MMEWRNDKGQFVKGYTMPAEYKLKQVTGMIASWKNRKDYIADIVNECPKLHNTWRAINHTEKGKKAGVSEEWRDYRTFYNDVRSGYKEGLSFRRLDVTKPFSKNNYIWATREECVLLQSNLVWLTYNGETLPLKTWADRYNMSYKGLKVRYSRRLQMGYTTEEVLFGRKRKRGSKIPKDINEDGVNIRAKASKMISSYKHKDRIMGVSGVCDISIEWMVENILTSKCVYCGDSKRIGCDRIDNTKGHTKDNVVPCCVECNTARSNHFSYEEMRRLGKTISDIKKDRLVSQ